MKSRKRIFISHSSKDHDDARTIVTLLQAYGCDVWYDEHNLGYGDVRRGLEDGLADCQVFLLLLSKDALTSWWVGREIAAALRLEEEAGMLITPAILRPCVVPLLLSGYRRLDFTSEQDAVAVLESFIHTIHNEPVFPKSSPFPSQKQEHPLVQSAYSIGNINAKTVTINQGDHTYNFYGNTPTTFGNAERVHINHIKLIMEKMGAVLDDKQAVNIENIEIFMSAMYTMNEQKIPLPADVVAQMNAMCKRLGIISLL